MKRIKKIIIFLLISITVITKIYPTMALEEKNILEISKLEVNQGEIITLKINLNQIEKEKFSLVISSNESLENTNIDEDIEVEITNEEICFNIDKSQTNIESINLEYLIRENIEIGKKINFTIKIIDVENVEETFEQSITVIEKIEEPKVEEKEDDKEENKDDDSKKENEKDDEKKEENNQNTNTRPQNNNTNSQTIKQVQTNTRPTTNYQSSTSQQVQTVKYNGSPNNYLKSLKITNYELDKKFTKEKLTYFVTIPSDIESLSIIATPESSTSKVSISGNTSLKEDQNKIIINVEAENGNVKTYRIFVMKDKSN